MKKCLSVLALSLMFCLARGEDFAEAPEATTTQKEVAVEQVNQMTAEEAAACDRIAELLNEKYTELDLHATIEAAMQEIADANREDFETALRVRGVDVDDKDGDVVRVLPLPTYFIIK